MLMRKLKSVSRFLVLILLFSLILPSGIVQADGKDARSTGTLTVHKYEQEPEAGAGEEGDGSADQQIPEDAEPLEGVEFTITMTHKYNPDADTWTEVSEGASKKGVTDSNGKYTFQNLELGRYEVKETNGPDHVNLHEGTFIVDIPMTSDDGTSVNYDVHIYPKNETIRGAVQLKKLDGDTGETLEGVTFELFDGEDSKGLYTTGENGLIGVSGLAYGNYFFKEVETVDGYVLGDQNIEFSIVESGTISEDGEQTGKVVELTTENYVEPEIEKKVDEDAVNRGEIVEYTLTIDLPGDIGSYNEFVIYDELDSRLSYVDGSWSSSVDDVFTFDKDGQTLTWSVNNFDKLVGKAEVTISFKAQVAEDAEPDKIINNKAVIEFENEHGNDGEKESDETPVRPTAGNVFIEKVDGDDPDQKLDGAKFELRDKDGNVVASGTTNAAGELSFENIDYGTYELVETIAPKGYNKLTQPIEVVVNDENKNKTYVINNYKSEWQLPRTGGIGTIPFTIIGLLIMGSAVYLYIRRRNLIA